jgi:hypothetical protein
MGRRAGDYSSKMKISSRGIEMTHSLALGGKEDV